MLVKMPGLEKIPVNLRNCITRPKKIANEKNQTVKEIAGKDVDRVPTNLRGVFRDLLKSGKATIILWYNISFLFILNLKLIKNQKLRMKI